MRPISLIVIIFLLSCYYATAQPFFEISHFTGSVTIRTVDVKVTPILGPASFLHGGSRCGFQAPYLIGQSSAPDPSNAYKYEFSRTMSGIRYRSWGTDKGEVIAFYINGVHYPLTAGNLDTGCKGTMPTLVAGNLSPSNFDFDATVTITGVLIDSIRVQHLGQSLLGTAYNFAFLPDTIVVISPFQDTALCINDTLAIEYKVNASFLSGNIFTFQLSDTAGSFANPLIIGTISDTTGGVFKYVIPPGTLQGVNYLVRIIASKPSANSFYYGKRLSIAVPPANLQIMSNSPVCSGDTLKFSATATGSPIKYEWKGASFISKVADTFISNTSTTTSGTYKLYASILGCTSTDSIAVIVNQTPLAVNIIADTVLCMGDTLLLSSTNNLPGATWLWIGPNNFSNTSRDVLIKPVALKDSGNYYLRATLSGGCYKSDSVVIRVKPSATDINITSNNPVCSGDSLVFSANTVALNVAYKWSGPNNFNSTNMHEVIDAASIANIGSYIVTAIIGDCEVSDTLVVLVDSAPAIPIILSNSPLTLGGVLKLIVTNPEAGVAYRWIGPDGFTSSLQNPLRNEVTGYYAGYYILNATKNGCTSTDSILIKINGGDSLFLNVYPNPNNGNFQMHAKVKHDQQIHVNMLNSIGQEVYRKIMTTHDNELKTDIQLKDKLPSGMYLFNVRINSGQQNLKIVIHRAE